MAKPLARIHDSPEKASCRACGCHDLERARFFWLFRPLYAVVGRRRYRCSHCGHVQWKHPLRVQM